MNVNKLHTLKIESTHDAMASCSCGWSYGYTGKRTPAEIKAEYRKHLPGKEKDCKPRRCI